MEKATLAACFDPYFHRVDVGPAKADVPRAHDPGRRFWIRSMMLVVALMAVWLWLWLWLDPMIGLLALQILALYVAILVLVVTPMGLGLLGFGLCSRLIGWLGRSSSRPEE